MHDGDDSINVADRSGRRRVGSTGDFIGSPPFRPPTTTNEDVTSSPMRGLIKRMSFNQVDSEKENDIKEQEKQEEPEEQDRLSASFASPSGAFHLKFLEALLLDLEDGVINSIRSKDKHWEILALSADM